MIRGLTSRCDDLGVEHRSRADAASGEFITETFEYDGGRQATVYVPPDRPEAIVFAGDGESLSRWGADLAGTGLPATMVVGVHRHADETLRIHEYSPGFDPDRFAAHEAFLMQDVRAWVATRWGLAMPAERTAMLGVSASGELALAMGLRHPDIFGSVMCASPGAGYPPPEKLPAHVPRAYLVGGTQEPFFLRNATLWAAALVKAGATVAMKERSGSHGDIFWRREFPLMVAWAFGG